MHDFLIRLPESVLWQMPPYYYFSTQVCLIEAQSCLVTAIQSKYYLPGEINQAEDGTDIDYSKYNDLNLISLLLKTGR